MIIGGVLIVLLQSVVIAALLVHVYRRRRAEEALRESEHRYLLATSAGVGVWDWNFETNEIYISPGLKSKLGFEDAEISKRPEDWGSRVHPRDLAAASAQVKACMDGESDVYAIEHRMLHKDGSVRWFLSRGSALRGADGKLRRLVGTKVDITELKRAHEAIDESAAALRASNDEIQHLAGSLISAQDAERARIARDLHDDVSQQIAALSIALSALQRRVGTGIHGEDLQADWSAVHRRTEALVDSVRGLSRGLHPDARAAGGLAVTLGAHCREISEAQGIAVTFTPDGDLDSLDSETALCFYRVAQEALRNVVSHAGARKVQVLLFRRGESAELTVADDGGGFDLVEARRGKGLGLISINERVRLAGGTLTVITERRRGTKLQVRLPTSEPTPAPPAAEGVPR